MATLDEIKAGLKHAGSDSSSTSSSSSSDSLADSPTKARPFQEVLTQPNGQLLAAIATVMGGSHPLEWANQVLLAMKSKDLQP